MDLLSAAGFAAIDVLYKHDIFAIYRAEKLCMSPKLAHHSALDRV